MFICIYIIVSIEFLNLKKNLFVDKFQQLFEAIDFNIVTSASIVTCKGDQCLWPPAGLVPMIETDSPDVLQNIYSPQP